MTPARSPSLPAFHVSEWCIAGAVCTGGFWAVGVLLGRVLFATDISQLRQLEVSVLLGAVILGIGVGVVAAAILLKPTLQAVLYWGVMLGIAAPVGIAMSLLVADLLGESLPRLLGSSLGFAVGGAYAGFAGYVWSRWHAPAIPLLEEETVDRRVAGTSAVARQRRFSDILRMLPIVLIALSALGIADRIARADPMLAFLVGVLGISSAITLWDHEQRLRQIEARLPTPDS